MENSGNSFRAAARTLLAPEQLFYVDASGHDWLRRAKKAFEQQCPHMPRFRDTLVSRRTGEQFQVCRVDYWMRRVVCTNGARTKTIWFREIGLFGNPVEYRVVRNNAPAPIDGAMPFAVGGRRHV